MASSDADVVSAVRRTVAGALDRQKALRSRRPIVVAVSGGVDSLCLLDALVAVVPRAQKRLFVGHVDHQLRPEAAVDGEYVKSIAESYGLAASIPTVDVPALAKHERLGIEAAACLGRYRALRRLADRLDTDLLVTGHTHDDSVETILLHLLRGSGMRGLSGIGEVEQLYAWSFGEAVCSRAADLKLIRPLLGIERADTVAYCEAREIRWLTDATNANPAFTRNRVRAHLLPVLRTYNPSIDRALFRMGHVMRDEDVWLDRAAKSWWRRLARTVEGRDGLDLAGWRRLPVALQRRLVRLIASSLGHEEIGFEAVERALAVGSEGGPPRADLGAGLSVERRADTLIFEISMKVRND